MKKNLYITAIAIFLFSGIATAQHATHFTLSYNVSFPSGDLSKFVEKTSWRGGALEWKGFINEKMRVLVLMVHGTHSTKKMTTIHIM